MNDWWTLLINCISKRLLPLGLALLLGACGGMPARQTAAPVAAPVAAPATAPATAPAVAEAVEIPREASARYGQALVMMKAKRYAEAMTVLQEMTRDYPDLAGPYLNLGIVYLRMDRATEAEQSLRAALELQPENAQGYTLLGLAHRESGRFAEARQDYERALELDPLYPDAHLNLAILFDLYLGQPRLALDHYERYQRLAGAEDKQVALWITDLKQRLPAGAPAGGGGS